MAGTFWQDVRQEVPMKKFTLLAVVAILAFAYLQERGLVMPPSSAATAGDSVLQDAYTRQQSNVQVTGVGIVTKVLKDDLDGSRHQRFLLELGSGQTLLVSHNIDLAPRVENLKAGDTVEFFGEYEWNPRGGVIHWTHHDPRGRHAAGWIKHRGKTYQ